jgi:hypothetical protein|tara:strand:+ start:204 stop:416 length:213 start_codon:yes stop_codon:yes gene_type:complete
MSDEATTVWIESVIEVLEDMCTDIKVFRAALEGYDKYTLVDKFGGYPPHYVAEVLLESLHEKHVQKELDS